jgi:hypothetical protein
MSPAADRSACADQTLLEADVQQSIAGHDHVDVEGDDEAEQHPRACRGLLRPHLDHEDPITERGVAPSVRRMAMSARLSVTVI